MSYVILIFNILALFFWVRLWSATEKEFYFNPFLSGTIKLTDSVLGFFRPVLYLPSQMAALVVMLFIVLFKSVLLFRFGGGMEIKIGGSFFFTPLMDGKALGPLLLFNLIHTLLFIARLWALGLLLFLITPAFRVSRGTESLEFLTRPFSTIPVWLQPLVLIVVHGILTFALLKSSNLALAPNPLLPQPQGAGGSPFTMGPVPLQVIKHVWLAALSIADGLLYITRALFAFLIGNLLAALSRSYSLADLCSEGVELLLGRFARRGTPVLGLDFTPLIFFFVVDLLYHSLCQFIYNMIHSPLFN